MVISELTDGGERDKLLFDAIRNFKILQLGIKKQANGEGLIEIKGSIDEKTMSIVERLLN